MANTRDIRRRIRSVTNTAKITKAMQMVASSKMRRAQENAVAGRPYALLLNAVLAEVTHHAGDFTHPLMQEREVRKRAVIVVSTDKGLCGALNGNLLREVGQYDSATTVFVTAGRRASQFVARSRRELAAEFSYSDAPTFGEARTIARLARDLFEKREVDAVDALFTNFVNTLSQRPMKVTVLPVTQIEAVSTDLKAAVADAKLERGLTEFLFEPDPATVLGAMLPQYLNFLMYQILLEAKASEHSARMVAMKNATENAHQLIKDLTLDYNKMRQALITNELLEISSATMALG